MNHQDVLDIELKPGESVMARLRPYKSQDAGDTKVTWSRGDTVSTEIARAAFTRARREGFMGYSVSADGKKGAVLNEFDETAERIILAPPMQGGA